MMHVNLNHNYIAYFLYSQNASMKVDQLEDELKDKIKKADIKGDFVYYNKGL